jgi:hypothetical protein
MIEAIQRRVLRRAPHEGGRALHADHFRPARGERQREVAQAAEKVSHALSRPRIEEVHGALHEHAIHRRIYLRELRRPEA